VILHVNYTAEADGALRTQVEQASAGLDGTIMNYLTNNATGGWTACGRSSPPSSAD
jgi:hypothetical protein